MVRGRSPSSPLPPFPASTPRTISVPVRGAVAGDPTAPRPHRGRATRDERFRPVTLERVLERFPGVMLNLDIKERLPAVEAYEARRWPRCSSPTGGARTSS